MPPMTKVLLKMPPIISKIRGQYFDINGEINEGYLALNAKCDLGATDFNLALICYGSKFSIFCQSIKDTNSSAPGQRKSLI